MARDRNALLSKVNRTLRGWANYFEVGVVSNPAALARERSLSPNCHTHCRDRYVRFTSL
jgi:hypothetical protein